MTTYYAVKDPQGEMCSDACMSDSAAWKSACKQDPSTDIDEDFKRYRAARLAQGYRIEPVGCYNPATQVVVDNWKSVADGLPTGAKAVLAHYKNSLGNSRIIKAQYMPKFFEEYNSDSDGLDADYCEESDCYYWPEGWYEKIDNWDDYSAVVVYQGEITHWMPLPASPDLRTSPDYTEEKV